MHPSQIRLWYPNPQILLSNRRWHRRSGKRLPVPSILPSSMQLHNIHNPHLLQLPEMALQFVLLPRVSPLQHWQFEFVCAFS